MPVLEPIFDKDGEIVGHRFNPTGSMYRFAMERAKPENLGLENKAIIQRLGLSEHTINGWTTKYGEHFTEWLHDALETFSQPIQNSLAGVGYLEAMRGGSQGFPYWKELARTYGVIKNEAIDVNIVDQKIRKLNDLTPEQLEIERNALLASLREMEDDGGPPLAEATEGRQPGSPGGGDRQLPKGPVGVDDAVGDDGGHPQQKQAVPAVPR